MDSLEDWELDLYNGKSIKYIRSKYPNVPKPKVYASKEKIDFAKDFTSQPTTTQIVQNPTKSDATEASLGFIEQFILNCVSDVVTIFKWIYRHPIWTIMLLLILTVVVFVIWLLVDYLMNLRKTNKPVTD